MVKIYTTSWCPSCIAAKRLFDSLQIAYQEINIEEENISRQYLVDIAGGYSVPQIIINNQCIGGYTDLLSLHQNNKLNKILNEK